MFLFFSISQYNYKNGFHQLVLILSVIVSVYFIAKSTEWKVLFWRDKISMLVEQITQKQRRLFYSFRKN
jgi:hypothetical protein